MIGKTTSYGLIILILAASASAAKVGVYVEFPDGGSYSECVDVTEGIDGYQVMQATDLGLMWGGPHALYGHSLCKIEGEGTETTPTGCEFTGEYWNLWIIKSGSSWTSMPVGYDGGDTCWNREDYSWDGHYCAVDGDVLGFAFGEWNTKPGRVEYGDICKPAGGGIGKKFFPTMEVNVTPHQPYSDTPVNIRLRDNDSGHPVKDAAVEVFDAGDTPGLNAPLTEGETGRDGEVDFILDVGHYTVRITRTRYGHRYLDVEVRETTTTTSTTTTSTTTTSTTTTTVKLPEHFLVTTTTDTTSTTTLEELPPVGAAVAAEPGGGLLSGLWRWLTNLL